MGLFDFFKSKKRELSLQELSYKTDIETFHKEFKTRHRFQDGWLTVDLLRHDINLSFSAKSGLADLALSISPCSPGLVTPEKPADILFDVCLSGEKKWGDCKNVILSLSQPLQFFDTTFEPAKILTEATNTIPRLNPHGAGETGFWLWLPLPDQAFQNVKAFDAVSDWCIRVAEKLASL